MQTTSTAKFYVDPKALPTELAGQLRQDNAPPITYRGLNFGRDDEGLFCQGPAEQLHRALDHQLPNCPVTQVVIDSPYGTVHGRDWDDAITKMTRQTPPQTGEHHLGQH